MFDQTAHAAVARGNLADLHRVDYTKSFRLSAMCFEGDHRTEREFASS